MIRLILIAVVLGVVPFLLGMWYTRFVEEEKNSLCLNMAAGYVMAFALFEILALPLVFQRSSLTLLVRLYAGVTGGLAAASLVCNGKRILAVIRETWNTVRHFTWTIWLQLVFILGQIGFYLRYQHTDADDAFYVAAATTARATDTILSYSPYTGTAYRHLPSRYVLSPFYAFTATVSRLTGVHPATVAHTVFMIVFLLLAYAVYAQLGRLLFSEDSQKTGYFLLLLTALLVFSGYSERTAGMFLLVRLWQGKAVLAGILLPFGWYLAMRIFQREGKSADWLLLAALMCACCLVSSMGIMLGAIMLGIVGIVFAIYNKSLRILLYSLLCCLPNLICAGIYFVIR